MFNVLGGIKDFFNDIAQGWEENGLIGVFEAVVNKVTDTLGISPNGPAPAM